MLLPYEVKPAPLSCLVPSSSKANRASGERASAWRIQVLMAAGQFSHDPCTTHPTAVARSMQLDFREDFRKAWRQFAQPRGMARPARFYEPPLDEKTLEVVDTGIKEMPRRRPSGLLS